MSTMNQLNSSIVEFYDYCLKQGGKLIKINLIHFLNTVLYFYFETQDPRVVNWPMMDSPMKTVGFLIGYLISLHLIKEHMANKKPYELRGFLIFYNFMQVIGSFYIFLEVI